MLRQLKKITFQIVAGANVATILIMLLSGYADRLNPEEYPLLSNLGLAFPVFLTINLGFMIFWLVFHAKGMLIPLAGYLVCYFPIRTYIPVNIPHEHPKDAIKVMSYNVWAFALAETDDYGVSPVLDYICKADADIVCLQEATRGPEMQRVIDGVIPEKYKYIDSVRTATGNDILEIYSKFPILSKERIKYKSDGNLSAAFKLKIGNDTVIVINNHLETTGLSDEQKKDFKNMMKGELNGNVAKIESKRLIDKIAEASKIRAPQAKAVAEYVAANKGKSIILCGDFNDNPLSYVRRTISKGLTDCYVATGNGAGISYHKNAFYVRIDNIMCSDDWKPYGCKVDNKIKSSDHYPIYCWLKKRDKP